MRSKATKMNIEMLQKQGPAGRLGLKKHAQIGALLMGEYHVEDQKIEKYCVKLMEMLERWTNELKVDRLGKYGIKERDVDKIVEKAGLKNNPVNLSKEMIKKIVLNRL